MQRLALLLALCLTPLLQGCVVGAISGAATQERPLGRSLDDSSASLAIQSRLLRRGDLGGVSIEVADGLVLLAGHVDTAEQKLDAERIAWSAPKVLRVANEIEVGDGHGLFSAARDRWVSGQLRTRLFADSQIRAVNINIETRDGVVYLLGLARSPAEIGRITDIARHTRGVKKVVSFITTPEHREQVLADPATSSGTDAPTADPDQQLLGGETPLPGEKDPGS